MAILGKRNFTGSAWPAGGRVLTDADYSAWMVAEYGTVIPARSAVAMAPGLKRMQIRSQSQDRMLVTSARWRTAGALNTNSLVQSAVGVPQSTVGSGRVGAAT